MSVPRLRLALVVTAGGTGLRMGAGTPKQFLLLAGRPVLARTLEGALRALVSLPGVQLDHLVLSHPSSARHESLTQLEAARCLAQELGVAGECACQLVEGGATRQDSVRLALQSLDARAPANTLDAVMVHDGVRPLASAALFQKLVEVLRQSPEALGVVPLVAVADTLKRGRAEGAVWRVTGTVDRDVLRAVQTPQLFRWPELREVHALAAERGLVVTDEAMLAEILRPEALVLGVEGEARNLKITRPEDLPLAEAWLASQAGEVAVGTFRVGQGFDVHAFADGRPMVLGGVHIPHPRGLAGHSDADVLLHAITDALLGAAGLGDIGSHFPDTDERWRGADSWLLLREAAQRALSVHWRAVNVDATVIGEEPRVRPYAEAMCLRIAQALDLEAEAVNVKGTTTEQLGFTGRREGLAAQAVVLVTRVP